MYMHGENNMPHVSAHWMLPGQTNRLLVSISSCVTPCRLKNKQILFNSFKRPHCKIDNVKHKEQVCKSKCPYQDSKGRV